MKIAIPIVKEQLSLHFGHCEQFAVFQIDDDSKKIIYRSNHTPPAHEPGVLPKWLHELGVDIIISSGMGQRAQQLFVENNIKVVTGVQSGKLEDIVIDYLKNSLVTGQNICDH